MTNLFETTVGSLQDYLKIKNMIASLLPIEKILYKITTWRYKKTNPSA